MSTIPTPKINQFRAWCRAHRDLAEAVALATAFAQTERQRVNAYIKPVFDQYEFYVAEKFAKRAGPRPWVEISRFVGTNGEISGRERITNPDDLYLSDDEPLLGKYYRDCDAEHRKHGFTGPDGYCPALCAEHDQTKAENALLESACELFHIDMGQMYGENRKTMLRLIMGACFAENPPTAKSLMEKIS